MLPRTKLPLAHRLALIGVLVASLPFPFVALVSRRHAVPVAPSSRSGLTASDLDFLADSAYRTVDFSRQELSNTLSIAGHMLTGGRGVRQLKGRQVIWPVTGGNSVKLPLLSIRKTLLLPSANGRRVFVSEFSSPSGAQCSIFQRMNTAGDMLWVATSLPSAARGQAIGTVIPAAAPETRDALDRRSYFGPVDLAGGRTLAGFEPISRADGFVIGMLAISLPETAEVEQIHQALSGMPAGSRGELFAGQTGLPIPPAELPEIIRAAKTQPFKTVEARYRAPGKGEMVAHLRYFAPWDWLVGVTVPQGEMAVIAVPVKPPADRAAAGLALVFLLTLTISAAVWWRSSKLVASPILIAEKNLKGHIERLLAIAGKVSRPDASIRKQGLLLERTAAALSEASRAANLVLAGIGETVLSTRESKDHVAKASLELEAMQTAVAELTASNSRVSGLVKDIAGIALQSRLLALNASIEAARAGHHGASFSVVADEFGTLAQRCSENATSTAALLTNSVTISTSSMEHLARINEQVGELSRRSDMAAQSLTRLLEAGNQQARTIAGLERSLQHIDKQEDTRTGLHLEIRAEAARLQQTAVEIGGVVTGLRKTKKAKLLVPKSRSFGAKAPADTRSARPAC